MSESNQLQGCAITGIGSYVPERVLTNADLAEMVDTNDEWITTRTGICLLYTSPSPRDRTRSRMPSSA